MNIWSLRISFLSGIYLFFFFTCIRVICARLVWDRWTHPDPHEAVSEYNPRQQEYKGLVTTEECRCVCCVDLPEGLQVQVVGEDPQQAKWSYLGEKHPGRQPVVPKKTTTLPVQKEKAMQSVRTHIIWLPLCDVNQSLFIPEKKDRFMSMWNPLSLVLTISFWSLLWCHSFWFIKEKIVAMEKQVLTCTNLSFMVNPVATHNDVDRFSTRPQEETREKLQVFALSPVLGVEIKTKETLFVFSNIQSTPQLWAELQIFQWIPSEMKDYTTAGMQESSFPSAPQLSHPIHLTVVCASWSSSRDVCKKQDYGFFWSLCSHFEDHILYFVADYNQRWEPDCSKLNNKYVYIQEYNKVYNLLCLRANVFELQHY